MRIFKRILINIALVIAGVCITILLAEIFVRIFYPESHDHVLPSGLYENDGYLGWKLSKEKSVNHHSSLFDVNYCTNSFGFRDKKRTIKKKHNEFRILLYGDSQTFGWGNPVEKRFSNLLEESLPNVEIWNLSVPAYGLDQEILSYKKDVFETDAVIFFVSGYTLSRINYDYLYQKSKPKFALSNSDELKVIPPKEPDVVKTFIDNSIRWMYLPFFLEEKISSLSGKPLSEGSISKLIFQNKGRDLNNLEKRLIIFAKDLTESRDNLMIILFNSSSLKGLAIKDFCIQNDIICYDININEKSDDLILGSTDGHWNSKANGNIFKHLLPEVKQLREEKLIPFNLNN
jgi:hypothetical protein